MAVHTQTISQKIFRMIYFWIDFIAFTFFMNYGMHFDVCVALTLTLGNNLPVAVGVSKWSPGLIPGSSYSTMIFQQV